jgi:hypothetical protein
LLAGVLAVVLLTRILAIALLTTLLVVLVVGLLLVLVAGSSAEQERAVGLLSDGQLDLLALLERRDVDRGRDDHLDALPGLVLVVS